MAAHQVTFLIDMRQEIAGGRFDPRTAKVGVRGGVAPLSWGTTALASDADGDGRYEVTVTFPHAPFGSQPVAYKFKVEREGPPNSGWEEGRNRQLRLAGERQTAERLFDSHPEPVAPERSGDIRTHPAFASRYLPARDVQVYLPPRYDRDAGLRYPVLYLHDGQNVFDAAAVGMEWQVDETAEQLIGSGAIAPLIVVAVSNTEARTDEYTPTFVDRTLPDGRKVHGGGKAPLYARFLLEELKPFIDRTYRTRTDAASTAVGGASHGGLVSLYLALEHPEAFGHALVMSPSAMWDNDVLIKRVRALPRKLPVRFWVDVGSLEPQTMVSAARRLRDALIRKGWREGQDLRFVEQAEGGHDEISWASRMPDALQFLWPRDRRAPAPR
jgi:predicted alpha/beta superfamily hydrolase